MSDKPNGYSTMEIGGQTRPFHVGTNQGEVFASLPHRRSEDGRPMSLHAYGELFSLPRLRENSLSSADVRDFVYSALVSGCQVDGLAPDFSYLQVGYWLDDADADEGAKPFAEMLNQVLKRAERQFERQAKNGLALTPAKVKGQKKAVLVG